MAHFAKLGVDNVVLGVVVVDNVDCMTRGGIEREEIGVEFLKNVTGHETWKKCSYNTYGGVHIHGGTPFRANYPGAGYYYNSEHDIFYDVKPDGCDSWTLNTTTGLWDPPIPSPELTEQQEADLMCYTWDESAYQADNTTGWVLGSPYS